MADLKQQIEDAANAPKQMQTDMGKIEEHPLPDLIAADQYLAGKDAAEGTNANGGPKTGWGCVRWARGIPPGSQ